MRHDWYSFSRTFYHMVGGTKWFFFTGSATSTNYSSQRGQQRRQLRKCIDFSKKKAEEIHLEKK